MAPGFVIPRSIDFCRHNVHLTFHIFPFLFALKSFIIIFFSMNSSKTIPFKMMDIENINGSKLCRACLMEEERMESLLDQDLLEMFFSCTSITVTI